MSRPMTKLYVAKFGSSIGRRELEDVFCKYGEIYSCRVNDGYATVSYKYQENAEKAISKLNGSNVFGGSLLVEHTLKKSRDDGYSSRSYRDGRQSDYRDYRSGQSGSRYGGREYDRDNFRRTSKPPREDKEKFIREGLCFTCGGQGHISRRCPEGRDGGSNGRGRVSSNYRSDRERKSYRDRSRSDDRNKGKSRSRSSHDKDKKKRSRKHSKRSSSSSINSKKFNSKSRKDKKRSASSSSQSSNSSRSNSENRQKKSNEGEISAVGNQNDQKKEVSSSK